jgi:hypothetical protein
MSTAQTPDLSAVEWRKSTYSNGQGGDCIEVADDVLPGVVFVRDSKDPQGPALGIRAAAWQAFVSYAAAVELPTA